MNRGKAEVVVGFLLQLEGCGTGQELVRTRENGEELHQCRAEMACVKRMLRGGSTGLRLDLQSVVDWEAKELQ